MLPATIVVDVAQNTQSQTNRSRSLLFEFADDKLSAKSAFPMNAEGMEGRVAI
jgi:hypothetical protein